MKDIILNDDFDLEATAGELGCRESDEQTLALLMETVRGASGTDCDYAQNTTAWD